MNIYPQVQVFLDELTELSKKHGMTIEACGCCNSPFVLDISSRDELLSNIVWDEEAKRYTIQPLDEQ